MPETQTQRLADRFRSWRRHLLILVLISLWILPVLWITRVETWPSRYPSLLAEWSKRGLVQHFPPALPKGTAPAKVSSTSGFLQGGGWLQIRCTLPPAEVETAFEHTSKEAKAFYDGGTEFELANVQKDGLPGTRFHTADTEDQSFPPDYRIFIYDARPYRPETDHQWNHGSSRGVVISRARNEVIYFAEDW